MCTFYVAVIVPYNCAFILRAEMGSKKDDRPSMISDVIVEGLFILGKIKKLYLCSDLNDRLWFLEKHLSLEVYRVDSCKILQDISIS